MRQQNVFAGVTDAQQMLIGHWQSRRDGEGRVARENIDPGALRSTLACISIVETDEDGDGRFRIAGSRLREIFGVEVRGMRVAEIAGVHGECYALGLSAALERGEPVGGVIESGGRIHAWLRLPLAGEDGQLNQVLCHDELLPSRRLLRPGPQGDGLVQQTKSRFAA
ncbi:PAS domain-containing protein [Hyphomonas sp. WL0036]|uniref:PAS domain-containing protein n=1 Tax=Hyphomonas sediminis TaxID=2866160 RepID=UPI001C81F18B|nr:PAS domain-containing protein [Hyphomonas sediminis]MBY9065294.1 PAS domain-containing protein [Hyphomonas sediminis]